MRIVDRRADGTVVRGAKVHTSVSVNANELMVPTRAMTEADAEYAVAFAIPLNTPDLTPIAGAYLAVKGKDPAEYPLSRNAGWSRQSRFLTTCSCHGNGIPAG